MATDYSYLYDEYPLTVSLDQLYRICHISKRKAKWLLDNGYIPCHDSGKKTRRYKIYTVDIVKYLRKLETEPNTVATPVGQFNSKKTCHNSIAQIDKSIFLRFIYKLWENEADALTVDDIQSLLGYKQETIRRWMNSKKLQYIRLPDGTKVIAKQWLIEFIAEYITQHPNRMSAPIKLIMAAYLEQIL